MRCTKDAYSYRVAPSYLFLGLGSTPKECINFLLDTLRPFSDRIVGRGGDNEILSRYTHSSSIDGGGDLLNAAALVIAVFVRRYVEAPEWFIGASIVVGPMRCAGQVFRFVRAVPRSRTLVFPVALEHTSILNMNY